MNSNRYVVSVMSIVSVATVILAFIAFQQIQLTNAANKIAQKIGEETTISPTSILTETTTTTPTKTPSPMNTPTSTPTIPTDTPTVTLIYTLTPTPTATSTSTATSTIPLTSTPTPLPPEAVVISENGLNLRSGPGLNYNVIGSLKKGDTLDIQGRVAGNDGWIKVVVVEQSIEGWVSTLPNLVEINMEFDDIQLVEAPPAPVPAPTPTEEANYPFANGPELFHPNPNVTYTIGDNVPFRWREYPLAANQYYSIRVVLKDNSEDKFCIHTQTKTPEIMLKLDCPPGIYKWSVGIATNLAEGIQQECPVFRYNNGWCAASETNDIREFGLGVKHPLEGTGGGGSNTPPDIHREPSGQ